MPFSPDREKNDGKALRRLIDERSVTSIWALGLSCGVCLNVLTQVVGEWTGVETYGVRRESGGGDMFRQHL